MSVSLTLVFFGIKASIQIYSRLPQLRYLERIITKARDNNKEIKIYVIEPIERYTVAQTNTGNDNFIIINKPLHEWLEDSPLDNIEGTVFSFCFSDEETDTYSIMEELQTQKYDDRYYFNWSNKEKINIVKYVDEWFGESEGEESSEKQKIVATPSSPRLKSSKKITLLVDHYQLYSGDILSDDLSDLDKNAIYNRMIILCDYIRSYLRFRLNRKYNIAKMRALPDFDEGYTETPFFNDTEIQDMIKNSCFFQIEDPILKGFLMTHKVCVTEGGISPLEVKIDLQTLLFTHGQFRRELLTSMMKIVANFCYNNELLTKDDFASIRGEENEEEPENKKESNKSKKSEVSKTTKTGITINKLKITRTEIEIKSTKIEKPHNEYFSKELWDLIEKNITAQINE